MNNIENEKIKRKEGRVIAFLSIGVLTLVSAISGATYAYFQATASKTFGNSSSSESAYVATPLTLTVTPGNPTDRTKKLIPVTDANVATAANSTNKCLDSRGNAVCHVYTITVTNNSTANYWLDGTFTLTAASMDNLKWAHGTNATTFTKPATTYHAKSDTSLTDTHEGGTFKLDAGGSKSFYIVIWISETGGVQNDSGSFTGTVTFNGYSDSGKATSGITSTIRS